MIPYRNFIIFVSGLVGIDILSKFLVWEYLHKKIFIFFHLVYFQHVKNPGIAFSFPLEGTLLKLVTLCLIFGIIYYYVYTERKKQQTLIDISFILIFAGAFGNGIERIFLGEVTDFIGVTYFAIFNLADSYIFLGAVVYAFYLLRLKNTF